MVRNFPNFIRNINLLIQKSQQTLKVKHTDNHKQKNHSQILKYQGKNLENIKKKMTHQIKGYHNTINSGLLIKNNQSKKAVKGHIHKGKNHPEHSITTRTTLQK